MEQVFYSQHQYFFLLIVSNNKSVSSSELYLQWYRQARLCNDTSSLLNNDFASSFWVISEGGSKYNNDPLKPQCTQHKSIVYCRWDHYYSLFSWRYWRHRWPWSKATFWKKSMVISRQRRSFEFNTGWWLTRSWARLISTQAKYQKSRMYPPTKLGTPKLLWPRQ